MPPSCCEEGGRVGPFTSKVPQTFGLRCEYTATLPGMGTRLEWPFEDPAALRGTEEERLARFREVRDVIEARVHEWLGERAAQG